MNTIKRIETLHFGYISYFCVRFLQMHKNPRSGNMIKFAPVCDIHRLKKYVSSRRTSKDS